MISAREKELGAFIRRHKVDNGRRGITAGVALLVGLAAGGISVPVLISAFQATGTGGPSRGLFPGLLLGLALICLWAGVTHGLRYVTRTDEVFRVREGGLVYEHAAGTHIIGWDEIVKLRDYGQDNALSRALGWDVHCVIKARDGGRVRVSGFTEDAQGLVLAAALAVNHGVRPTPPQGT